MAEYGEAANRRRIQAEQAKKAAEAAERAKATTKLKDTKGLGAKEDTGGTKAPSRKDFLDDASYYKALREYGEKNRARQRGDTVSQFRAVSSSKRG